MIDLTISNKKIDSVFELVGFNEDALTKAFGWLLCNSSTILSEFINNIFHVNIRTEDLNKKAIIRIHTHEFEKGITDLEIDVPGKLFILIEAKKGWILPSMTQLLKYSGRADFSRKEYSTKVIASLSDASKVYTDTQFIFKEIENIPFLHISWNSIILLLKESLSKCGNKEKQIINEFLTYLSKAITMQDKNSNWVFVVSLGKGNPENWNISWRDIVNVKGKYFHPVGNRWPKAPPNYIAFRYDGRLQSIHYIKDYLVTDSLSEYFEEAPEIDNDTTEIDNDTTDRFLYTLGPAITPHRNVPNGRINWNNRMWVMIDTLLTANDLGEAYDLSHSRIQ